MAGNGRSASAADVDIAAPEAPTPGMGASVRLSPLSTAGVGAPDTGIGSIAGISGPGLERAVLASSR
jgi:hypothetical protein